ncbi:K(+)-transporting ATPase subunit F [Nitrolancea hollandica]|jgi:K+-transporting ATPase KdpF subunit|nr:K(+)-transporting ATPase subunit F [Nitrolancea hollandica]
MNPQYVLGVVLSIVVLGYLFYVLLRPERF